MKYLFKSIALLTLLVIAGSTFAQKKVFFDKNWKKTKEANAYYYRIITPQDGAFMVEDFFKESESPQMTGMFSTKKLKNEDRIGKFTYYYPNGEKRSEGEYENGKAEGEWNYWYNDGQKKTNGIYEAGERVGEWIGYHKKGNVRYKTAYVDGNKNGKSVFYFENDSLDEEFNYVKGKKHGSFIVNHENSKLYKKGSYEKDSLVGEFEQYWDNGNKSIIGQYSNNKKDGEWIWFHKNGTNSCVGEYKKGKFLRAEFFEEDGEKISKKIQEKDMVEAAKYPGGPNAMIKEFTNGITKKVDFKKAVKEKVIFSAWINITVDEEGNVTERDWLIPDADDEDEEYNDEWGLVNNINNIIDGFATFEPREEGNRKVKEVILILYTIDFSKKGMQNLTYF